MNAPWRVLPRKVKREVGARSRLCFISHLAYQILYLKPNFKFRLSR